MTASIIPLQMNLVHQIWIYLPLPLMINSTNIKKTIIPHICIQIPSMLHLKTLLAILLPLLILLYYSSYLLMILNLPPKMNKYEPYRGRVKRGYWSREHYEKYATKRRGSIAPRDLINTRNLLLSWVSGALGGPPDHIQSLHTGDGI